MADSNVVKTPDETIAKELKEETEKLPYDSSDVDEIISDIPPPSDAPQFTFRSFVVGSILGTVISASNFYLGLKIGWTFGAGIFGSIFGYTIVALLSVTFARALTSNVTFIRWLGILFGKPFTAQEHATLGSVATAAGGGTLAGYVSGIPAMYRLGLLSAQPSDDYGRLLAWAIAASLYGIFFAVPLRKWFVIKNDFPFPSPRATAVIIKSTHIEGGGELAKKKTIAVFIAMGAAFAFTLLAYFVPVLSQWHVFHWISGAFPEDSVNYLNLQSAESWNFYIAVSFAYIGAGMMIPGNTIVSMGAGSILGWAIIGPLLYSTGHLFAPVSCRFSLGSCNIKGERVFVVDAPSARYWLLWVGVLLMLSSSFSELFSNWRTIVSAGKAISTAVKSAIATVTKKEPVEQAEDEDPAPVHQRVPTLWWTGGVLVSVVISIIVLYFAFGVGVGESILAVICGFLFAFIGLQSTAEMDINPIGTIAKVSQLVLAAVPPYGATGQELVAKQTANLGAGLLAGAAASQSVDMVSDLKTGHLVGASPRAQFFAQLAGSILSAVIGLGIWALFTTAFPCIVDIEQDAVCQEKGFFLPAVSAWYGITLALTKDAVIPASALWTGLALSLATIVMVVVKNNYVNKKYHAYFPNMNAVGIAFTLTDQSVSIGFFLGWIVSAIWAKAGPKTFEHYMYALAAGFIAGEGLFGIVNAGFALGGVEPATYIGLP